MNPYFLMYKSIGITWFMALTGLSLMIGYFIAKGYGEDYGIGKNKIQDYLLALFITGFIGARLGYVVLNFTLYQDNLRHVLKISHFNLSFAAGILTGLMVIGILAKKAKIAFYKLFKVFVVPFYLSASAVIWALFFDGLLIGRTYNGILSVYYIGANRHLTAAYLSALFLIGVILEVVQKKDQENKWMSYGIFLFITILYYVIKITFTP